MMPQPGDVLAIGVDASVQFGGDRSILFRVAHPPDTYTSTPDGWVWLHGYQVDKYGGFAVEKREVFVQVAGLRPGVLVRRPVIPSGLRGPRQRATNEAPSVKPAACARVGGRR